MIFGLGHAERAYLVEKLQEAGFRVEIDEHGHVEFGALFVCRHLVALFKRPVRRQNIYRNDRRLNSAEFHLGLPEKCGAIGNIVYLAYENVGYKVGFACLIVEQALDAAQS